jgi:CDP-diacylglycerol--serine O-phosphatidyltransferase
VRKIAILPTLLTLGNAVCGFAAIAFASRIATEADVNFAYSASLIFAAMVFDALDGYAARLSKTASDFGGQLDSLCDAISFGAAPAFLLLRLGQEWEMPVVQQALAVIAVLYVICAVLRLARFNVDNSPDPASHKRFKGLPSPAAAGCLASLALLRGSQASHALLLDSPLLRDWLKLWTPLGALVVALLMVSRLSYPHLTKQLLRGRRHFSHLIRIIVAVCLLALLREWALLLVFWGYALTFPMRYALARSRRRLPQPAGLDDAWRR